MTHIVRDVEKPGSKLHKKEVRAAAAHSLSLHAFSPRLAPSAALLLLLLGKLCTMQTVHHAHLLPLLLLPLPAACLHTDPGAVKMTQTFKLNRTEHPVLTLFPRCPERPLLLLPPPPLLLLLLHAPSPAALHPAWSSLLPSRCRLLCCSRPCLTSPDQPR